MQYRCCRHVVYYTALQTASTMRPGLHELASLANPEMVPASALTDWLCCCDTTGDAQGIEVPWGGEVCVTPQDLFPMVADCPTSLADCTEGGTCTYPEVSVPLVASHASWGCLEANADVASYYGPRQTWTPTRVLRGSERAKTRWNENGFRARFSNFPQSFSSRVEGLCVNRIVSMLLSL